MLHDKGIGMDINKNCCFTGHRPDKIKGSEADIRNWLNLEIMAAIKDGYDTFIAGMALGVDMWAAEEVLKIKESQKVKLVCAVPAKGVEENRTEEEKEAFHKVINMADRVEYLSEKVSRSCFSKRDKWMVDNSSRVIAVFNGTHGGTEYTIRYADKLGRNIIVLNDAEKMRK